MKLKRVLITGKNSYVGTNVEKWLMREPDKYYVESISVRDESWKDFNFSKFDVVFHTAGIAHIKETKKNRDLYFKVNRDLAFEVAKKAKYSGVKHFVFMSTMSVYGEIEGFISVSNKANPTTSYGKSKFEAENLLILLNDDRFKVSILRPPMIYGKDSPGNYKRLSIIVSYILLFPKTNNKRSILFILNFSEFVKKLIISEKNGLYFPQNKEYIKTHELVYEISKYRKKKILITNIFDPLIKRIKIKLTKKIFSDLYYDQNMSMHEWDYNFIDFEKSIEITEN
jgi:UDP-glucose 4-epimerase